MNIIETKKSLLKIGDIVEGYDGICIIGYEETVSTPQRVEGNVCGLPFKIVNLNTGLIVNAYEKLEGVDLDYTLLARNENVELRY